MSLLTQIHFILTITGIIIQFEMNACVNFKTDPSLDHSLTNFVHMLEDVPWTRIYLIGDESMLSPL
jgi:transcriptional antiterminator